MRDTRYVLNSNGKPKADYMVKAYEHQSTSPYYDSSALIGPYIDNGDGTYYLDVTTTIKATIVITTPGGTVTVPTNLIGIVLEGDNRPDLEPA